MISAKSIQKDADKFLRNATHALPVLSALAFMRKRERTRLIPWLLGAIGVAAFGSIAAVLIFSPRSRDRALGAAKDAYGRISDQFESLGIGDRFGLGDRRAKRVTDGLASSESADYGPTGF
ncbi:MAG: hypothetical protein FWD73_00260 [Polyangiaceae bacterium]|nr:hypothetical protein [Polyangiaceae bacterium]